jgi:hypothetical protein
MSRSAFPRSKPNHKGGLTKKRTKAPFSRNVVSPKILAVPCRIRSETSTMIIGAKLAGMRNKSIKNIKLLPYG